MLSQKGSKIIEALIANAVQPFFIYLNFVETGFTLAFLSKFLGAIPLCPEFAASVK